METLNSIGLDEEKSARTVDKLNLLLSDVQVFYMNVRGYHWNIKGKEFFLLHEKYEEL
jgi:starvation-inducible DNA-binding protein